MTQYLDREVAKNFAPPGCFDRLDRFRKSLVSQLTRPDAVRLASELIETAKNVAANAEVDANKIGGKVDVCVIDGIKPPEGILPLGEVKYPEEVLQSLTKGLNSNG
jgi:hypothetical protein